jgi:hypothetical protein
MEIQSAELSLFRDYYSPVPVQSITLEQFCLCVMEGDYAEEVNAIRRERNKDKRDELKADLPAVTISGTFERRNKESLIKHSGLICLDIDAKENPAITNWDQVVRDMSDIVNVAFASLSVSGNGCFVVIPLSFPHRHTDQFNALQSDFKKLGLTIDKKCSDISRLRGMTGDNNAHYNPDAEPYRRLSMLNNNKFKPAQDGDLLPLIQKIISKRIDITSDYKNWYEIGASLAATWGEKGRDPFHQLSRFYPKYDPMECDKQYNHCLRNPGNYSLATLFYYAKKFGLELKN